MAGSQMFDYVATVEELANRFQGRRLAVIFEEAGPCKHPTSTDFGGLTNAGLRARLVDGIDSFWQRQLGRLSRLASSMATLGDDVPSWTVSWPVLVARSFYQFPWGLRNSLAAMEGTCQMKFPLLPSSIVLLVARKREGSKGASCPANVYSQTSVNVFRLHHLSL